MKIMNDEGEEIEVFTAAERDAHANTLIEAKVGETTKEFEARIKEEDEAYALQRDRVGGLIQLTETQKAKLTDNEKVIYANQERVEADRVKVETDTKTHWDNEVEKEIKAKANGNADLEAKMRANLAFINIDARSAEQVAAKVALARGGVFEQNPDLLAVAGGFSGTVYPGGQKPTEKKESFADTPKAQQIAGQFPGWDLSDPTKKK